MASCLLTYFDPELCFSGFVQETPDLGGDVKSLRAGSSQCYKFYGNPNPSSLGAGSSQCKFYGNPNPSPDKETNLALWLGS